MNIHRTKQPAAVRAQILNAAKQVLVEAGAAALTFDSVLARTDLSKGGIQYHFQTKQALLDGLFDHLMQEFFANLNEATVAVPPGPDQRIRVYINLVSRAAESAVAAREAMVLLMIDPKYQTTHAQLVDEFCRPDRVPNDLSLTCRFAVEGLWQSQVMRRAPQPEVVASVRSYLLRMLDKAQESPARHKPAPTRSTRVQHPAIKDKDAL